MKHTGPLSKGKGSLLKDLRGMIELARQDVARAVNASLMILYWQIGQRIQREVLKGTRADYGKQIVATVSRELSNEFGSGFSEKAIWRMVQLAQLFPDRKIVATLSRELSWSHFIEFIPIQDRIERDFYVEMCRAERWSVRMLRDKINSMLFQRTALSKKPGRLAKRELEKLRKEDTLTPDLVFRDPYLLDFLNLKDTYSEKDLETAILRDLERFIVELGTGFSFVARQRRIIVDNEDYYIDLLFFHRKLKRLVAIDLKLDRFKAADKGQMELYLRWLEKYERQPGEEAPMGLILCAGKSDEQIELLQLDKSGIRVAQYLTDLPERHLLRARLHKAVQTARLQLAENGASKPVIASQKKSF